MSGLREHCAQVAPFLRQRAARPFLAMAVLFLISALLGVAACRAEPEIVNVILGSFQGMMESAGVVDESGGISFLGLLVNNWLAMVMSLLYGFIPFLFLPVLAVISNAAIIGVILGACGMLGMPLPALLAGILPHGIFELPALFLAGALGFLLCRNVVRVLLRSPKAEPMLELLLNLLRALLLVVFPLVLCAAALEAYVTPLVMDLFL